jgi:hypothetical protein
MTKKTAGQKPAVSRDATAVTAAVAEPTLPVVEQSTPAAPEAVAGPVPPVEDAAEQDAVQASAELPATVSEKSLFPLEVTLRNHSTIPVVETATNAYIGAGNSVTVTLHSKEQLHNMRQNFEELAARNYFDPALLSIDGLPVA